MSVLSAKDRERTRYHLGYLNVQAAGSIQYGIPKPMQTIFMVEQAMTMVIAEAVPRILAMLNTLDCIEQKLIGAQDNFAAAKLGEMTIERQQLQQPDLLEKEYFRWAGRLADTLGVPFYPYSNRFKNNGGVVAGNVAVRNS